MLVFALDWRWWVGSTMWSFVFETGAAAFGACVGSFLNVVIHRLPQDDPRARSLGGRSRCPQCGAQIAWRDNVPVFGWLLLRGRARCCGKAISLRYPLVEALTAALFVALAVAQPHGPVTVAEAIDWTAALSFGFDAAFIAFLVACTFIDWDHRILPDALTIPFMIVGCTVVALAAPGHAGSIATDLSPAMDSLLAALLGLGAGYGLTLAIRVGARAVFKKEAMGLGDVKFMGAIGAFLGWDGALLTFFLGCVVGAVGGMAHRVVTKDAYVPFGPFLAIGALITLFFKANVVTLLFETWPQFQRSSPMAMPLMLGAALLCVLALFLLVRRGRANG
jgi:leader peptidase (prepilin peptidase)/N-methyltransferase